MSLSDSAFEPGGKRNFLQLTDKDGEQPQIASVRSSGSTERQALYCYHTEIGFGFIPLYIDVHRMSRGQQIAVDWMTVHRSVSLDPFRETAVQAAVVTTAVHLTPTRPSSTNLRQVRFESNI